MQKSFRKQVLKCLRLYWQRGQVKNALLPDFAKCGGKGKERRANPGSKRGRTPRLSAKHPEMSMVGINITGQVCRDLLDGFQRFYVKAACSEYGITITPEDWPCHFLPDAIIGDRGELFTHDATPLIASLGVKLLNTAPYRADWKGIIERFFRLLKNDTTITWMPGAVHERGRGEHDFRLDACLTLREFREIIIRCVLHYNTSRRLTTYTLDEWMIPDHVQPYPIELWQWGLAHRRGHLRTRDRQAIRLALLPRGEAQVTRGGIRFKGVPYTCERALREQWYVRASLASWKVPVAYDPRNTDMLSLLLDQENDVEVATITDSRFANKDWLDVEDYLTLAKQATQEHRGEEEQALSDLRQNVRAIVTSAKASTAQEVTGMSKTERLEGIRANRQVERRRLHAQEAWTPHQSSSLLEHLETEAFSYADWIRRTQTAGGADGQ